MEFTQELLIFDTITQLLILGASAFLFVKSKELYSLSLQKGIKYIRNAMLFYVISFAFKYLTTLFDFLDGVHGNYEATLPGLILVAVNVYAALLGGFYLAYSLIWKKFEKDSIRKSKIVPGFYIVSVIIVLLDVYLMIKYNFATAVIFFSSIIFALIYAISANCHYCKISKKDKNLNPFLSIVGLGLGVYIVFFLENLIDTVFFTIHYYAWALAMVFVLTFVYNFVKLAK